MPSNKILIIVSVVAGLGLIGTGVFFSKSQSSQKTSAELTQKLETTNQILSDLEEQNDELEKELIAFKNTDLAKEVELLNLKLANTQKDLEESQKDASSFRDRVAVLELNQTKIKPYLNAIEAMSSMYFGGGGVSASGIANIDAKVAALKDQEITSLWGQAKGNIDLERLSWSGQYEGQVLAAIISRIRNLLR